MTGKAGIATTGVFREFDRDQWKLRTLDKLPCPQAIRGFIPKLLLAGTWLDIRLDLSGLCIAGVVASRAHSGGLE